MLKTTENTKLVKPPKDCLGISIYIFFQLQFVKFWSDGYHLITKIGF